MLRPFRDFSHFTSTTSTPTNSITTSSATASSSSSSSSTTTVTAPRASTTAASNSSSNRSAATTTATASLTPTSSSAASPISPTQSSSSKSSRVTSRSPINFEYGDDDVNDDVIAVDDDDDDDDINGVELMYNDFFPERRNPLRLLTADILGTYRACNPDFVYKPEIRILPKTLTEPAVPFSNDGLDNENNDLIIRVGDVLSGTPILTQNGTQSSCSWLPDGRYSVVKMLGCGTFGQVLLCKDEESGSLVGVKVLKNRTAYLRQGLVETAILTAINTDYDPTGERHTLRILDHFMYNEHLCIVNELLGCTLYSIIRRHRFRGLPIRTIKAYLRQILDALIVLERAGIVHCDLKPENVLADIHCQQDGAERLTLIDFGSACFEGNSPHTYIQSRNYRSPEVILGLQATSAIDMWSFGCIAAELLLGPPLFPGASEYNQLYKITSFLGPLPPDMIRCGSASDKYFKVETDYSGMEMIMLKTPAEFEQENNVRIMPDKKFVQFNSLEEIFATRLIDTGYSPQDLSEVHSQREVRRSFLNFLKGILELNPTKRWTASQARAHPFINDVVLPERYVPPPPERAPRPIEQCRVPENLMYPRIGGTNCELYRQFFGPLRYENKIVDAYSGREIVTLRNPVAPHYIRYRNVLMSSPLGAVTPAQPPHPLFPHMSSRNTRVGTQQQQQQGHQQQHHNYHSNAQQQQQQQQQQHRIPSPHHHLALNSYAIASPNSAAGTVTISDCMPSPRSLSSLSITNNNNNSNDNNNNDNVPTITSTNNNMFISIQSQVQSQQLLKQQQQQLLQLQTQLQSNAQKGYSVGSPLVTNLRTSPMTISNRPLITSSSSSTTSASSTTTTTASSSSSSSHTHYSSSYSSQQQLPHIAGKADIKRGTERLRKRNNISVRLFSPVQKCSAPPCDHIITLDLVPPSSNQPSSGSETPLRSIPAAARYPFKTSSRIAIRKNSMGSSADNVSHISNSVSECMSRSSPLSSIERDLRSSSDNGNTDVMLFENPQDVGTATSAVGAAPSATNGVGGAHQSIFALCGYGANGNGGNGGNVVNNASNGVSNGGGNSNPWNRILYSRNDTDENVIFPITSTKML